MQLKQEIIDIALRLIRQPTFSTNTVALKNCLYWIKQFLDDPKLSATLFKKNDTLSLLVTSKNNDRIDVIFNGHIDIVSAGAEQLSPVMNGDKLYGRGSLDMKGSLSVMLILAKKYLKNTKHALLISTDEELGGRNGCGYLIKNKKIMCRYFITGEPTNLHFSDKEKGVLWFTVKIRGKSSHASTPWSSDNPILKLGSTLRKIYKTYPLPAKESWITTVCPTGIITNNSRNQIPDEILIKFDCRYIPIDDPKEILKKISKMVDDIEIELTESPLGHISHPYAKILKRLVQGKTANTHYATDARFFYENKIPSVIIGPTGNNMHGRNEYVSIQSLVDYYKLLERFIKEI